MLATGAEGCHDSDWGIVVFGKCAKFYNPSASHAQHLPLHKGGTLLFAVS